VSQKRDWTWALHDEDWRDEHGPHPTREAALAAARAHAAEYLFPPGRTVLTGWRRWPTFREVLTVGGLLPTRGVVSLLDWLHEEASQEHRAPESSTWPSPSEAAQADLVEVLCAWAQRHGVEPDWWYAEDEQEHPVEPQS
jgi:hypothetical protein